MKFDDSNLLRSIGFCVLRPKSMIRSEFLFYRVLSDGFIDKAKETQTGTHYPATSDRKVLSMEIVLPPLSEQEIIIRRIERTFEKLSEIEKKYEIATMLVDKLSQSILAKAFRGELIEQDPNDEPAGELLRKIRLRRKT